MQTGTNKPVPAKPTKNYATSVYDSTGDEGDDTLTLEIHKERMDIPLEFEDGRGKTIYRTEEKDNNEGGTFSIRVGGKLSFIYYLLRPSRLTSVVKDCFTTTNTGTPSMSGFLPVFFLFSYQLVSWLICSVFKLFFFNLPVERSINGRQKK